MSRPTIGVFYRIVRSDPPTERDFWSYKAHGIPLLDPTKARLAEGVSVYSHLGDAKKKARRYPDKGQHIAVLRMPEASAFHIERTGPRRERHYTIWAAPAVLLGFVVETVPVD